MLKIKKGDNVKVLAGKDKGKTGKVSQVLPEDGKAVVEGVNRTVKHAKTKKQGQKGQKIEYHGPIALSSLALICPKCAKPTRVGFKVLADGKKARLCKQCEAAIE
jgi:large subunit ribosomal protein L24